MPTLLEIAKSVNSKVRKKMDTPEKEEIELLVAWFNNVITRRQFSEAINSKKEIKVIRDESHIPYTANRMLRKAIEDKLVEIKILK